MRFKAVAPLKFKLRDKAVSLETGDELEIHDDMCWVVKSRGLMLEEISAKPKAKPEVKKPDVSKRRAEDAD